MTYDLQGKGELIESVTSPNGNYLANVYLINEGGATVAPQIRVAIDSQNGNNEFNDKTIYWEYRIDNADVMWIDDEHVKINDKGLNIHTDSYNYKDYINK
ncbi:DUF5412 family protein [Halalkalibacter oceani]|uniref:DUF5412 family protein n=1 Tax=Halalkalibacter oceani TaxID=1653776 RepID=UPI00339AB9C4